MTTKVTLRQKPITGNRKSLYLDFYPAIINPETGKATRREFLNLFIFEKPKTPFDKEHNRVALHQAEYKRQEKSNEVNKPEIYSDMELERLKSKELGKRSFIDFFRTMANKRTGTALRTWSSVLMHLEAFGGPSLTFADVNEKFCQNFKEYLQSEKLVNQGIDTLSNNTAAVYFALFKTSLKQAYKDGLLQVDLGRKIDSIRFEETTRTVLTIQEVNSLIKTECANPVLKQAAIFSVYTGLRFSDIQRLTWDNIEEIAPGEYVINFRQKKTKGVEVMPVSSEAIDLLGPRGKNSDKVFPDLVYSTFNTKILAKWSGLAGIQKNVTFHCFRHTFATLQLTLGTDIYTVSKLLGHRDLKTTQIYAKIIDETKRTASNRIKLDVNNWK